MGYLTCLVLFPSAAAALAAIVPSDRWRPWLLPLGSATHLALVMGALSTADVPPEWHRWLVLDPPGKVFLLAISVLHLMCMLYAPGYLALRRERPNRVLCVCMLLALAMMSLVVLSHHLGLMWVAVEATTLVSAPGLYFNHNVRSLEATWKYLLICSVGIALALLGSLFLAYSAIHGGLAPTLLFHELLEPDVAHGLSRPWLHAAFILLLVGYGTKMGLSPMHTWKPDAYGEAPGIVGALLAGAATSCVFLAVVRIYQIAVAGGEGDFASKVMIFMGLLSMATAAVFMVRQRDFKRLLAYSSVEHMGILVFGLGVGGSLALFGTLLHVINNAMTKGVLFLAAGNIHRAYGSKLTDDVAGAMRALPLSGSLFLFGFLAGCGSPPFSPFASEFSIVSGAFADGHYLAAALFLVALLAVFVGMGGTVLSVVLGEPSRARAKSSFPDGLRTGAPIVGLMVIVVWFGVRLPPFLANLLDEAVRSLAPLG
ncbi:MAG TPA: proton-conducting transporter membrane subunit [Pirellulales bacterium]|nr:proton-conducting transporter membrane subunit [Pirellulales bacterium]